MVWISFDSTTRTQTKLVPEKRFGQCATVAYPPDQATSRFTASLLCASFFLSRPPQYLGERFFFAREPASGAYPGIHAALLPRERARRRPTDRPSVRNCVRASVSVRASPVWIRVCFGSCCRLYVVRRLWTPVVNDCDCAGLFVLI